ncbi:MAG TPA: MBOAT family protein, partial [Erysipelotrichaceae bacterium]|nr:MBOAT family protein [Erysipelotrichaceae bacterium]
TNIILFIILIIGSSEVPKKIWNKFNKNNKSMVFENILLILCLVLTIANLVDQTYNPFLYFRF